jgi:hypothetical protein
LKDTWFSHTDRVLGAAGASPDLPNICRTYSGLPAALLLLLWVLVVASALAAAVEVDVVVVRYTSQMASVLNMLLISMLQVQQTTTRKDQSSTN